jgi:hypothetical protein
MTATLKNIKNNLPKQMLRTVGVNAQWVDVNRTFNIVGKN